MGCPRLSLELGAAAEGEADDRREANPRHARYITAAATSADTIDANTILSCRNRSGEGEGERGEGVGGRPPAAAGCAATCAARRPGRPFSELVPPCTTESGHLLHRARPEVDICSTVHDRKWTSALQLLTLAPTSSGHACPWHIEPRFWPIMQCSLCSATCVTMLIQCLPRRALEVHYHASHIGLHIFYRKRHKVYRK